MQITLYTCVMNHAATLPLLYLDLVVVLSVDFKRFPATEHEMEDLLSEAEVLWSNNQVDASIVFSCARLRRYYQELKD